MDTFLPIPAGTYFAVIDAWDGRTDGSPHTITVICDAPCTVSAVEPAGWGAIKAHYRD